MCRGTLAILVFVSYDIVVRTTSMIPQHGNDVYSIPPVERSYANDITERSSDYVVGPVDSLCENGMIDNRSECKKAAEELNFDFQYQEEESDFPGGCYVMGDWEVYFNKNFAGTSHKESKPICGQGCDPLKEGNYKRIPATNDWHYVEIKKMADGNYRWKNKANKQWTLIPNNEKCNELQVGTDCPYYNWPTKNFYTKARFNQNGIYGPYDKFYSYEATNPKCNPLTWENYDHECCSATEPCGLGEGDCDSDDECSLDLVCGTNNCITKGTEFTHQADCCELPSTPGLGNPNCLPSAMPDFAIEPKQRNELLKECCSEEHPCGVGEGDCDNDNECEGDLTCGKNNCVDFPSSSADCCQ